MKWGNRASVTGFEMQNSGRTDMGPSTKTYANANTPSHALGSVLTAPCARPGSETTPLRPTALPVKIGKEANSCLYMMSESACAGASQVSISMSASGPKPILVSGATRRELYQGLRAHA